MTCIFIGFEAQLHTDLYVYNINEIFWSRLNIWL